MKKKSKILLLISVILLAIYWFWPKNENQENDEIVKENQEARDLVFKSLVSNKEKKIMHQPSEIDTTTPMEQRDQEFEEIKQSLKTSTTKCRAQIESLLPGEEKTEELPSDPALLKKILLTYLDSNYSKEIFKLNSFIAKKTPSENKLKNFVESQEDSEQCYPFVEQEVLLKMLDDLTEDEVSASLKDEYQKVMLDYIEKASVNPQSLFHMASYVNILQAFAENNLIENRYQFELERLKNELMGTVRDTDEDLIKSLRNDELSAFVDIHRRRFDSSEKLKSEFTQLIQEIKETRN